MTAVVQPIDRFSRIMWLSIPPCKHVPTWVTGKTQLSHRMVLPPPSLHIQNYCIRHKYFWIHGEDLEQKDSNMYSLAGHVWCLGKCSVSGFCGLYSYIDTYIQEPCKHGEDAWASFTDNVLPFLSQSWQSRYMSPSHPVLHYDKSDLREHFTRCRIY